MNKKALWIAIGVLSLGAAASVYYFSHRESSAAPGERRGMDGGRPVPVVTAAVKRGDIDVTITALGTVTARNTATVKPRVDGLLQRIAFQEGQLVKAGDLLAEIDPRPFQALLDQANGQLVRDQALLANAQIDLERYRSLLAKDSIARQQVEAQEALVKQYQGTVQADRGTVDNAKLQLAFTRITAPLTGRLGLRQVDAGNMVRASDTTGVVVITQTQPIMVVFAIAADYLTAVVRQVQAGEKLQVEAWDREGKLRLATGQLLSLDNQIDTTTGTVKLKAEFANADNALFPNQFVNARLRVETRRAATLMPLAAVQRGTLGTFVYVVNAEDKTVSTRSITLGPNTADTTAVEKGLEPGEQVVVDGADKLRQGARIEFSGAQAPAGAGERKGPRGGDGAPAAVQAEKSEKTEKTEKADTTSAAKPAEAAAPAGKGRE